MGTNELQEPLLRGIIPALVDVQPWLLCSIANSTVFFEPPINDAAIEKMTAPSESRTFHSVAGDSWNSTSRLGGILPQLERLQSSGLLDTNHRVKYCGRSQSLAPHGQRQFGRPR